MRSNKGVNREPGANMNLFGKFSNPENGLSDLRDVMCWFRDRERESRPLREEDTVADSWKWEETHPFE